MEEGQNTPRDYFYRTELERFRVKVGVFLFLVREEKILLLRRSQTGVEDGWYVVPMGGLKQGETPTQALIREAEEEANIILSEGDVQLCHTMYRLHTQPDGYQFYQIDLFFRASTYQGEIKNMEPYKCDDLSFFDLKNLPENTAPFIVHALECLKENKIFSEFGFKKRK